MLSVEAGFKADLLDNTARISGTVFKYRVKDMQLTAGSGSTNQNRLVNAAKAEGQGFELDAQAIIEDLERQYAVASCGVVGFQFAAKEAAPPPAALGLRLEPDRRPPPSKLEISRSDRSRQ